MHLRRAPLQVKRGFKLWAICDSVSRYCLRATLYTGKADVAEEHAGMAEELGKLASAVLLELDAAGLLGKGHHVVCDRAFTNIPLAFRLAASHQTTLTGTVNTNRKGVDLDAVDLKDDAEYGKVERGTYEYATTTLKLAAAGASALAEAAAVVVTLTRWQGSKPVTFLSTEVEGGDSLGRGIQQRNTKASGAAEVHCSPYWEPLVRRLYNMLMGGVDGNDQLRSYYNMRLKRVKRWWVPLFIADLDILCVNAFITYNEWERDAFGVAEKKRLTNKQFRIAVVKAIKLEFCEEVCIDDGLAALFKEVDTRRGGARLGVDPMRPASRPTSASPNTTPGAQRGAASPLAPSPANSVLAPPLTIHVVDEARRVIPEASSVRGHTVGKSKVKTARQKACVVCTRVAAQYRPKLLYEEGAGGKCLNRPEYNQWYNQTLTTYACVTCFEQRGVEVYVCPRHAGEHSQQAAANSTQATTRRSGMGAA